MAILHGNTITVENGTVTGNVVVKKGAFNLANSKVTGELAAFNKDVTISADSSSTIGTLAIATAYSNGNATLADTITAGCIAVKKTGSTNLANTQVAELKNSGCGAEITRHRL